MLAAGELERKYLDEDELKNVVFGLLARRIYEELRMVGTTQASR
jgi:hypothetical protein